MSGDPPSQEASPARRAVLDALVSLKAVTDRPRFIAESSRFAGLPAREKALAERMYRGTLQNRRLLDKLIELGDCVQWNRTSESLKWVLRLLAYQKVFLSGAPDYAIGQQAVALARGVAGDKAAGFMNAVSRRLLRELPEDETEIGRHLKSRGMDRIAPELRYSIPDDIAGALESGYGRRVMPRILNSLNGDESSVWLRVNTLRTDPEALGAALAAEGVRTEADRSAPPQMLRWDASSRPPWETECWNRGEIAVQDLGASLAVAMLNPRPGETVLDACAAPGGKSGQIWEAMNGTGTLVALEIERSRRRTLRETLDRLYGPSHAIRIPEVENDSSSSDISHNIKCQAILLDAPCLGFGLLRRHPEARWDGRWSGRAATGKRQSTILGAAGPRVEPGGRICWVTCSPTRFENEDLISAWLKSNRDYRIADPSPLIPAYARSWTQINKGTVRTRPDRAAVDGFAITILRRG